MNIRIPLFFLLLLVVSACGSHKENVPETFTLVCDTICDYPYFLKGEVLLKGNYLVMVNPLNAGNMYVLDTRTGEMTDCNYSIDNKLAELDTTAFPMSFYHYDMGSYYHYKLENGQIKLSRQNLKLKGRDINRAVQLNDHQFALLGFFRTGLLGLYDKQAKTTDFYGHYPLPVDIPFEQEAMRKIVQDFQGNIAYSAQHSKIVYSCDKFAYLSCYHFNGSKLKFQWEHRVVPVPAFAIENGFIELKDQTAPRGGFSDVTVAGDYIFACYTQQIPGDTVAVYSILAFDMDGHHKATYRTNCPLSTIRVDLPGRTIYGVSRIDDPVIVRSSFDFDE